MLVTYQLTVAVDFHSTEKNTMEVKSMADNRILILGELSL